MQSFQDKKGPSIQRSTARRVHAVAAERAVVRTADLGMSLDASDAQREAFDHSIEAVHHQVARGAVQLRAAGGGGMSGADVGRVAERGLSGGGGALPFRERIQAAFGRHDVSRVAAHDDSHAREASAELGALGYTRGESVAFGGAPSLFTAAHEAAHVVQQRAGVRLKDGVGRGGDVYERHADDVASAVVRGDSAEALLDRFAGGRGGAGAGGPVQLREEPGALPASDEARVGTQLADEQVAAEASQAAATSGAGPASGAASPRAPEAAAAPEAPTTAPPSAATASGASASTAPEQATAQPEQTTAQAATTQAAPTGEAAVAAELIKQGQSANQVTDTLFFARHPELSASNGAGTPELQAEWVAILSTVVRPASAQVQLDALRASGAATGANAPATSAALIYDPKTGEWTAPDMSGADLSAQMDAVWAAHEPTYHNGSEFGQAGCHRATSATLGEMGWENQGNTFTTVGPEGLSPEEKQLAIAILESELAAGRPCEIGINYQDGDPGNSDGATDHWLYVAAMSTDTQGARVFLAVDNAKVADSKITEGGVVPFSVRADGSVAHDPYFPSSSNAFSYENHVICQVRKCSPKAGVPAPPELAAQAAAPTAAAPTSASPEQAPSSAPATTTPEQPPATTTPEQAPATTTPEQSATLTQQSAACPADAPAAPLVDEPTQVRQAWAAGEHNVDQLTNVVFFARHPDRIVDGKPLPIGADDVALASEWKAIRADVVRPIVAELSAAPASAPASGDAPATPTEPASDAAPADAAPALDVDAILAPYATYVPFTKTIANLDEEGLGARLAGLVASSASVVMQVFEAIASTDRDDVALVLVAALSDADARAVSEPLKGYMIEQLTTGWVGADEQAQADRLGPEGGDGTDPVAELGPPPPGLIPAEDGAAPTLGATGAVGGTNEGWSDPSRVEKFKKESGATYDDTESTLDVAQKKVDAEKANAGATHYDGEKGNYINTADITSGSADASTFRCSTFTAWTLSAAGYDIGKALVGGDGKAFRMHEYWDVSGLTEAQRTSYNLTKTMDAMPETPLNTTPKEGGLFVDKKSKDITMYMLIEGMGEPTTAMASYLAAHPGPLSEVPGATIPVLFMASTIVNSKGKESLQTDGMSEAFGGDSGNYDASASLGQSKAGESYDDNLAIMGNVGAIELSGIGFRVEEKDQKPGDFAQIRKNETGGGHAFMIYKVHARGSGWFGPDAKDLKRADGTAVATAQWLDDVELFLDKDTDPTRVGAITAFIGSERIEANTSGSGMGGDGGVRVSGENAAAAEGTTAGVRSYFARLWESTWAKWQPAARP